MCDKTVDITELDIDVLLQLYEFEASAVDDDDCSLERQNRAKENVSLYRQEVKRRILASRPQS